MLVITGNPGVGKHTLAKSLAVEFDMEVVDINQVAIQSKTYKKRGKTLDVDTEKLSKRMGGLLTKNVIVVGHLAPYVVPRAKTKLALVLRKNPYKLLQIYKKRKYTKDKAFENAGSEILGITAYDAARRFGPTKVAQLDTTGISVKEATRKAKRIIRSKKGDRVDWLELVSRNGDLAKFFPQ